MSLYSYIGKGKCSIKVRGAAAGLIRMGNIDKADFKVAEDKQDLPDFQNAGGGLDDTQSTIKSVTMELNLRNISPENLAIALRAGSTTVAAGAVTDEVHTAYTGGVVPLDHVPDPDEDMTVTNSAGSTTYDEDVDYERTISGWRQLPGGAIADASDTKTDYTKLDSYDLEALINSGEEYEFLFEGLNEAKSGLPVIVRPWRVKFSAADNLSLIGAQFGSLPLKAEVLIDDSKVGDEISKYFKVQMAKNPDA